MIHGLAARARYPRLGVIRLGVKERNAQGKEYPKEVSWFVVPPELKPLVGEQPTKLSVLLPSNDPEVVFPREYVRYQGRLCTWKCDGETYLELPIKGEPRRGPCQKPEREPCPCGAKPIGRLNVILLDGPVGVYQVIIGGEQRIADLYQQLVIFADPAVFGRLKGILFTIERLPEEVQVRGEDGKRFPRTGYPVRLRCDVTARQALQAQGVELKALPGASGLESEEEVVGPSEDLPHGADESPGGEIESPKATKADSIVPNRATVAGLGEDLGSPSPAALSREGGGIGRVALDEPPIGSVGALEAERSSGALTDLFTPSTTPSTVEQHNVLLGLFRDRGWKIGAVKAFFTERGAPLRLPPGLPPVEALAQAVRERLGTLDRLTVEQMILHITTRR